MNPNPFALESWPAFLLTLGTILTLIVFTLWLSAFLLNTFLYTDRESEREHRWTLAKHLTFGGTLLLLAVVLIATQFTLFYEPYVPPTYGGKFDW
jgi:hypothetical protein